MLGYCKNDCARNLIPYSKALRSDRFRGAKFGTF